jgi:hypothetical protein
MRYLNIDFGIKQTQTRNFSADFLWKLEFDKSEYMPIGPKKMGLWDNLFLSKNLNSPLSKKNFKQP